MSDLGDYGVTREFEDAIREIVGREIDRLRPKARYAVVDSINTTAHTCMVTFNGDTTSVRIPYRSIAPNAAGQVVAVEGTPPDQYIADVVGDNAVSANVPWINPTLGSGFNQTSVLDLVKYRKIIVAGQPKIELAGRVNITSGTPSLLWTMPTGYRPVVNLAPMLIARNPDTGSNVAHLEVFADGTMNLTDGAVGIRDVATPTAGPSTASTAAAGTNATGGFASGYGQYSGEEHSGWPFSGNTGTNHEHGIRHEHFGPSHVHDLNSHTHAVTRTYVTWPTWISVTGVSYYI